MEYGDDTEMGWDLKEFMWDVIKRVDAAFIRMVQEKSDQEAEVARLKREQNVGRTPRH